MAAPSKVFPVIVDADVDADSPGDNTLVEGLRDVGVNLDERIGESGAFPASRTTANHNHDGSNSALISTTLPGASSIWIHSGSDSIAVPPNYVKAGFTPTLMISTFGVAQGLTGSWNIFSNVSGTIINLVPGLGRAGSTTDFFAQGGYYDLNTVSNIFLMQEIAGFLKMVDYSGTGASQQVSGVGFQPDAVFCSYAETTGTATLNKATLKTTGQTVATESRMIVNAAVSTNGITSLSVPANDGFTAGTDLSSNVGHARDYRAICFKDMTLTNGNAIKILNYTGDAADPQAVTGVGFRPDLIMFVDASSATSTSAGYICTRGASQSTSNVVDSIDSDGFSVKNQLNVARDYSAVCLKFAFID